jgi:hypothetical protein
MLGSAWYARYDQTGDVDDLGTVIEHLRAAVDLASHRSPGFSSFVNNLANALRSRFHRTHDIEDLDQAVEFTFGYGFKPWRGPSIATAQEILSYLDEVIDENDLVGAIRYRHRVTSAHWSTVDRGWTVEVTRDDTGEELCFTTDFLWMCQGYYRHRQGYTPD